MQCCCLPLVVFFQCVIFVSVVTQLFMWLQVFEGGKKINNDVCNSLAF